MIPAQQYNCIAENTRSCKHLQFTEEPNIRMKINASQTLKTQEPFFPAKQSIASQAI